MSISHAPIPVPRLRRLVALIGFTIYVVLDVTAAQILKRTTYWWDPTRYNRHYSIANALYHHDIAPNVNATARFGNITYPVMTNNLGFRDARVRTVPLKGDRPRVVFIGDSFTEGSGVSYQESYVGLLDRHLGNLGVEVLNAAAPGYAFAIYRRKLEHLLNDVGLQCDFLVVGIDMSDVNDDTHYYKVDRAGNVTGELETAIRWRTVLRDNSLFLKVADAIRDVVRDQVLHAEAWRLGLLNQGAHWTVDAVAFEDYGRKGLQQASAKMDQILALTRSHGIGMAIIVWPWPIQIVARDSNSVQVRFWSRWARQHNVAFFDLFPVFLAGSNSQNVIAARFIPHDVHWNVHGHQLVAETLIAQGLADSVVHHVRSTKPRSK